MNCCCSIQAGTFGIPIVITLKDCEGMVVFISGSSSLTIRLESPDGTGASYPAAFPSGDDGTQGRVAYTLASGNIPDDPASVGTWQAQAVIDGVPSSIESFEVKANIGIP